VTCYQERQFQLQQAEAIARHRAEQKAAASQYKQQKLHQAELERRRFVPHLTHMLVPIQLIYPIVSMANHPGSITNG